MADQSVRGQFVWHELKTPDANAAHAFYAKAIGWKSQPWEQDPSYVMFAAKRGPIGATAAGSGAPPHWLPYIGTGDIQKTVKQAQELGGSVVQDVDSLSSGSRYAVLKDPFGATFGVYESAEDYGTMTPPQAGEHSWHELMTGDYRAAFDFYSALFGWQKMDEHDMGELGTYMIWGLNGRQMGGMFKAMEGAPPSWLGYVSVKDVHQTARKVQSAGGKVVNGPMEVPGGDWVVQVVDPQGAMFAAHASAARQLEAPQPKKQKKVKAAAAETPAPVTEDQETPATEDAPPAEKAPEEKAPAKRAPRKKAPAPEAPAKEAPPAEEAPAEEAPPAQEAPAKKAPAKKAPARKSPAKKAPSKKAPAKKKSPPAKKSSKTPARKKAGKKAAKKRAPASKGAGAKKSAKKASKKVKTRSGGSKKAAKQPRKKK